MSNRNRYRLTFVVGLIGGRNREGIFLVLDQDHRYGKMPVAVGRPLHLTARGGPGLPSLRTPEVRRRFVELLGGARERGVRTVSFALLHNHIHWLVVATSRQALWDATRYVFSQLARHLNRKWGRRGSLFVERFWSTCCRSVRQAFAALGYVLRNPAAARCFVAGPGGFDRYVGVDETVLASDRFLQSVVGPTARMWRGLLRALAARRIPWVPIVERMQLRLTGM